MNTPNAVPGSAVLVYEAADGSARVEVRLDREMVWLTQDQMARLFGRERSVVTKHIRNAFREGELEAQATRAKFEQVQAEGARTFYRRGIIETWGRGTLKIARLMREQGLEPPAMAVREGAVVVTFAVPAEVTGKTTGEATGETTGKAIGKPAGKTPAAVLQMLAEDPSLTVLQLAARLKKSELTIHRAIRSLRESGRLQRIGPDKGGHWQVIE